MDTGKDQHMTLEEMNDMRDMKLAKPRKHPGMSMAEMAAKEMRAQKMRPGAKPDWKPAVDHSERAQIIIDALKDGPKTRKQLAAELGVSYDTITEYMIDVTRPGPDGNAKVRRAGMNEKRNVLFELVGERT